MQDPRYQQAFVVIVATALVGLVLAVAVMGVGLVLAWSGDGMGGMMGGGSMSDMMGGGGMGEMMSGDQMGGGDMGGMMGSGDTGGMMSGEQMGGMMTWMMRLMMSGEMGGMMGGGRDSSSEEAVEGSAVETMTIADFVFSPGNLYVPVGATVTFVNRDSAPHTATDTSGVWDTGLLSEGESATLTFDTPGTFIYYCTVHPNMRAQLVVE